MQRTRPRSAMSQIHSLAAPVRSASASRSGISVSSSDSTSLGPRTGAPSSVSISPSTRIAGRAPRREIQNRRTPAAAWRSTCSRFADGLCSERRWRVGTNRAARQRHDRRRLRRGRRRRGRDWNDRRHGPDRRRARPERSRRARSERSRRARPERSRRAALGFWSRRRRFGIPRRQGDALSRRQQRLLFRTCACLRNGLQRRREHFDRHAVLVGHLPAPDFDPDVVAAASRHDGEVLARKFRRSAASDTARRRIPRARSAVPAAAAGSGCRSPRRCVSPLVARSTWSVGVTTYGFSPTCRTTASPSRRTMA